MILLLACAEDAPVVSAPTGPIVAERPWPTTIAEAPAPAGARWQTLRHANVHARLLLPDGAEISESDSLDEDDVPWVRATVRVLTAELTYAPTAAWYAALAPEGARRTADNVAWQAELPDGGLRVTAYARGVRCVATLGPFDRAWLEQAYQLCGSVRPPPVGAWQPAPGRSSTMVPEGAWVEPRRGEMLGDSLLGPYAPRLYAGWFGIAHAHCDPPASLEALEGTEATVAVTRRDTAGGPAYVRSARATRNGATFDSGVRIVAPRGDGCCVAEVFPLFEAPSDAEIEYVVAMCDTTRGAGPDDGG